LSFAREGADVLISYLPEEEPDAEETVRVVESAGQRAVKTPGDIGEEARCQRLVEQAVSEFGKLDILVNNAACQMYREGIQSISAEELEHTYRTNVFSMFYLCKAALLYMRPGSSIVNTCSVEAYQPQPMLLDYPSTKAAIVNFTKGLAMEVAQQGIRVNCVAPGPVWTPLIPATMPAEFVSQFGQQESPMGRAAQPAELAPAYVFLASQESSYVNGETLGVTGGTPLP
jgi:NAD(P)-dependent dehydrogenase (short-subunit alcohol dehydrogenase family)